MKISNPSGPNFSAPYSRSEIPCEVIKTQFLQLQTARLRRCSPLAERGNTVVAARIRASARELVAPVKSIPGSQQQRTKQQQRVQSHGRAIGSFIRSESPPTETGAIMISEQKVAVITGASRGIGAGLTKSFRAIGYRVVANSRSISRSEIADDPAVVVVDGNIGHPDTAERILKAATDRFGRIDTLVNNAGIFIAKPFVSYSEADFAAAIEVNLAGFFRVSQRVAAWMLRAGSGHIINITATIAEQPMATLAAAPAALTKGGLNAVTRSLAIEYASRNIRVNAVSPGIIRTPMHPPESHEFLAGLQPMDHIGEKQDIVDAVMYLEDASFVTGEILHVDGGASAGRW
jgi:NAD(P)-dependent dehydrogenase (short-subunit alcohol dehydrogenase family)